MTHPRRSESNKAHMMENPAYPTKTKQNTAVSTLISQSAPREVVVVGSGVTRVEAVVPSYRLQTTASNA
jgi:hypothetical protein